MNRFYESTTIVQNYLKYRPIYTNEIPERVMEFYREHNPNKMEIELMLDVGCGSGQTANIFQSYCHKIIACDVSQEQIKQARLQNKYDHVHFRLGQAENTEMDDDSVDLLVAGVSAHWFDLPKFIKEAKRVLKPSGCLCIFTYRFPTISLLQKEDPKTTRDGTFLLHSLMGYGASENPALLRGILCEENHYDDIYEALPSTEKKRIDDIHVVNTASINDVCGYIRSVEVLEEYANSRLEDLKSANIPITRELVDLFDLAKRFKILIKRLWNLDGVSDDAKILKLDFSFTVLMAKI